MSSRRRQMIGAGVVGAAVGAAAVVAYRATHPPEASVAPRLAMSDGRSGIAPALFDMPPGVTHGDLTTPDGGTIHYAEKGEGRPLVLLHGVTLRHDVWAPQFHQLADRYRVIAVDLRGHGESKVGSDGLGLPRLADDLATVLESLDLRGAVVVGHSMGGMTVMRFCGDHRDILEARVSAVALVATAARNPVPARLDGPSRALLAAGQAKVRAGQPLPTATLMPRPMVRLAFGDHPHPRAVEVVQSMITSMDDSNLLGSLEGIIEHDARNALRDTRTPSLVVVGTRDLLTPVPAGRALARHLPGCEFVLLPRAGHQLMQERPTELAELIDALVARHLGEVESVRQAVATDDRPVEAEQVEPPAEPF